MLIRIITIALGVACMAAPSWAHHSATAIFDVRARVDFRGTLTEVRWINPHIRITVDVETEDGSVKPWVFESQPPQWFRRVGVGRTTFQNAIGKTMRIVGMPAHNGQAFGSLREVTFEDGTSFTVVVDRIEGQE